MSSTEEKAGEPRPTDKEYKDIILSDLEIDKKYLTDTGIPAKIIYYCKNCNKLIKPKRVGKKFRFSCAVCNGDNVAFGSEQSICSYYKLPQEEEKQK